MPGRYEHYFTLANLTKEDLNAVEKNSAMNGAALVFSKQRIRILKAEVKALKSHPAYQVRRLELLFPFRYNNCYQPSAGGLLELVLRPNLLILTPGNLGTPPKARDELAENSRDFALSESALLCKLYK